MAALYQRITPEQGRLDDDRAARQIVSMAVDLFMTNALHEARAAARRGEVPVGAVLVEAATQTVLAQAGNRVEELADPTAHAEVLVIREATAAQAQTRLPTCDLYVTLEPCALCAAAISLARLRKLVFGAYDPKSGGVEHGPQLFKQPTTHHAPEVIGGMMETECGALLKEFFADRRQAKTKNGC